MNIDTSMAMMNFYNTKENSIAKARLEEQKTDAALREQTDQFESILLKFMLEKAIKNDDTHYPKQPGSDIYHSMYIDQLSQELSGGFGYSELLFNFLKEQQNMEKTTKNLAHRGIRNPYGQSK